jgi:hypothetical protein
VQAIADALSATSAVTATPGWSVADVVASCRRTSSAVATALDDPAIPSPEAAAHYRAALIDLQASTRDCVAGGLSLDVATIQRATSEVNAGTAELKLATAALRG